MVVRNQKDGRTADDEAHAGRRRSRRQFLQQGIPLQPEQ